MKTSANCSYVFKEDNVKICTFVEKKDIFILTERNTKGVYMTVWIGYNWVIPLWFFYCLICVFNSELHIFVKENFCYTRYSQNFFHLYMKLQRPIELTQTILWPVNARWNLNIFACVWMGDCTWWLFTNLLNLRNCWLSISELYLCPHYFCISEYYLSNRPEWFMSG